MEKLINTDLSMNLDLDDKSCRKITKKLLLFLEINEISMEEFFVSFISITTRWAKSSEVSKHDFKVLMKAIESTALETFQMLGEDLQQ